MCASQTSRTVFVIGAGAAGLAAAWRLQEAGHSVAVLEAADHAGGRVRSVPQDGFLMEAGASLISGSYDHVLGLARDAGLDADLQLGGTVLGIVRDGRVHEINSSRLLLDGVRSGLLSLRSKASLGKLALDFARATKLLSPETGGSSAPLDTESAAEYCERRFGTEVFDYLIDAIIRGMEGLDGREVSKAEFFHLVNGVVGSRFFVLRGGMSRFTDTLAGKLDVRTHSRALQVTEIDDGVRLAWTGPDGAETSETGAGAVIALAGHQVPEVYPALDRECAAFLRGLEYSTMVSVNIGLSHRPRAAASVVIMPRTEPGCLFAFTWEHNKAPGRVPDGKGLIGAYVTSEQSLKWLDASDETITDAVLATLEPLVPGIASALEFVRVNRWYPVAVLPRPGHYRRLAAFEARRPRFGRVHLAGDYFSCSNLNTAVASGERAARELDEAIAASHRPRPAVITPSPSW